MCRMLTCNEHLPVLESYIPVFVSEKVSAHGPMGARPPPHGRSPIGPWALAHRAVGADFLGHRDGILPIWNGKPTIVNRI